MLNTLKLALFTPAVPADLARKAARDVHNTVTMWYATAIHEADHGTSKDWRLPVKEGYKEGQETAVVASSL